MNKWVMFAVAALLLVGGAVAALVLLGIWPGPSGTDRERSQALFVRAQAALEAGNQDEALSALDQALRHNARNPDALRMRALIYVGHNEFDAASGDMDALIGRGGAVASDYSLRCWLRARDIETLGAARADCTRAIQMDPTLSSAFGNRGIVNLRQNRNTEAWEDFNTAMRLGGSDQWLAWRLFGRGLAARGKGDMVEGREDIDMAIRSNPRVALDYAQFDLGIEVMRDFDDDAYAAASDPRSLRDLNTYLIIFPNGAHADEARAHIAEIMTWIEEDQADGRAALPGYSFASVRGEAGSRDDSFGAIAMSRSVWRVAFSTDYLSAEEAESAAAAACNTASIRDCEAFAFRNVCAALAISPRERARGLGWAHELDQAVRTARAACRDRGGLACKPVHSQCTPTLEMATPITAP